MTVIGDRPVKTEVQRPQERKAESPVESKAAKESKEEKVAKEASETGKNVFDSLDEASKVDMSPDRRKEVEGMAATPGVGNSVKSGILNGELNADKYTRDEIVVTPAEKSAFIEAVVSGGRYTQAFELFGGAVRVVIRSRTSDETSAMYSYMRHELSKLNANTVQMETDMQYLLLLAQVDEINGTKFPELKTPYTFVARGDGEDAPGWMDDMVAWKSKPEGLVAAVVNRIQLFEYKYWTMVREAADKNFWSSGASTAE